MLRRTPIIVILGSTATGKTKLSIELAKRFGGEVISADSMQVYNGLDISTAKATKDEQSQAVHHLLDICDVHTRSFGVVDFRNKALPIIDELLNNSKIPVIVGGTTYYIESLLWKVLIASKSDTENASASTTDEKLKENIVKAISDHDRNAGDPLILHNLLTQIDPVSAQRLHPNTDRKVRRALEVFIQTGRPMSEHLNEQQSSEGGSTLGGPLRFEHVICFWIKSEQEKLNERIDRRIDGMIAQGMLYEIRKCYNELVVDGIDPERGMMQAIGFKEFLPYLEKYPDESFDSEITEFIISRGGISGQNKLPVNHRTAVGLKVLEQCLDELRMRTKKYSRQQIKWVKNRIVSSIGRPTPPVYELDTTNAETNWHEDVYLKAVDVVESYIENKEPKIKPAQAIEHPNSQMNMNVTHFCEVCQRRLVGDTAYNAHMQSERHRKMIKRQNEANARKALANQSIMSVVLSSIRNFFSSIRSRIVSFFGR